MLPVVSASANANTIFFIIVSFKFLKGKYIHCSINTKYYKLLNKQCFTNYFLLYNGTAEQASPYITDFATQINLFVILR